VTAETLSSRTTEGVTAPDAKTHSSHRFPLHVRFVAYLYLVSVPFEIDFVAGGRSVTFWVAAALVFMVIVHLPRLLSTRAELNGRVLLPVFVLTGFGWLSYFWSINPDATFAASTVLLSTVLTWLAVAMVIADSLGTALRALITGTSLMSVQLLTSEVNIDGRADVLANVNDVAVLIALSGACLLAGVTKPQAGLRIRFASGLLLTLHVWAMLGTGSRAGALTLLMTIVLFILWSFVRLRLSVFLGVLIVVALMVGAFILMGITLPERIASVPSALNASDLNLRETIWRAALPEIPSLIGIGLEATPTYMSRMLGVDVVMHSFYLGVALELGVVGILIWAWFLIRLGAEISTSPWRRELAMMAITMAIMASTLTLELRRPLWVFLALLGAISIYAAEGRSSRKGAI
jgi:O-antigen ligase